MVDDKIVEKTTDTTAAKTADTTNSSDALQHAIYSQLVIQNAALKDIKELLCSVVEIQVAGMPEIFRKYDILVTSVLTQIVDTVKYNLPWISFVIINDGPNSVYIHVNDLLKNQAALKINESIKYSMGSSNINTIYLLCDVGSTANVRIYAELKRYPSVTKTLDLSYKV